MNTEKNIIYLYPRSFFNSRQADEDYQKEYSQAKAIGLNAHLIDIDDMSKSTINFCADQNTCIIYRGWMLSEAAYTQLEERFGPHLLTSKKDYYHAHHFAN
jgi:hypothetical protein